MKNNKEVHAESELLDFFSQLSLAGINIPKNLTFEFDSQHLQIFFNELANHYLVLPLDNNITEFSYYGHKIKLKQK